MSNSYGIKQMQKVNQKSRANKVLATAQDYVSPKDIACLPSDCILEVDTAIICSRLQDIQAKTNKGNVCLVEKLRKKILIDRIDVISILQNRDDGFHVLMCVSEIMEFFASVSMLPPFSFRKRS